MKKRMVLLVLATVALVAIGPAHLTACGSDPVVDLPQIEDIHLRMDPADIDYLKDVIEGESDDYVRERALLVLTDIAVRTGKAEDVVSFLKDLAYNAASDQLRTAAYSALDQIRVFYPLEMGAGLDLRIDGDIYQGNTVQLIAVCYCEQDVKDAAVGISDVSTLEDSLKEGIGIGPPGSVRFSLEGGRAKELAFDLVLNEPGRYDVVCTLDLGFDRVDYLTMEKTAQIRVEASGGAYEVTPPESTVPEDEGGLSSGWIALISVLAVIVVAGLGMMGYFLRRSVKRR